MHKQLEKAIAEFLGMEDAILYAAAFDANGGVFEPLLDENDAIISDALNHASIIDGIRLCKAERYRYAHNDMADLETQLQAAAGKRHKVVVTDGAFSMDGTIAQLRRTGGTLQILVRTDRGQDWFPQADFDRFWASTGLNIHRGARR